MAIPIVEWRARRLGADNMAVSVGDGGAHDVPFDMTSVATSYQRNPLLWGTTANGVESRIKVLKYNLRTGATEGMPIQLIDAAGQTANVTWEFSKYNPGVTTLSKYSIRAYMAIDFDQAMREGYHNSWFTFYNGSDYVWSIRTDGFTLATNTTSRPFINFPGSADTRANTQLLGTGPDDFYRFEIQVDEDASPKVRVRIYYNDSTTQLASLTADPPSVTISKMSLGDFLTDHGFLNFGCNMRFADVELWADYTLNGEYPASGVTSTGFPYKPKEWAAFEINSDGEAEELDIVGSVDDISDSFYSVNGPGLGYSELTGVLNSSASPTKTTLSYGTGTTRTMDVYFPQGEVPPGGWPTVIWCHGGFFSGGSKDMEGVDILANNFTQLGCVFVSVEYSTSFVTTGAYPSWNPSSATGRYPTFLLQYKEATAYLQTNASLLGLNPNRMIASGSSAGGYIAFAAVASRGVADDGYGRDLTLAGNTATFGCPNIPDPTWHAGFFWCPPINLDTLVAYDPTRATIAMWVEGNVPVMQAMAAAFMGRNYNNSNYSTAGTGVDDLIRLNAENLPQYIAHCWAGYDWIAPSNMHDRIPAIYDQSKILNAVLDEKSASLPAGFDFRDICIHDATHGSVSLEDMNWGIMKKWLEDIL